MSIFQTKFWEPPSFQTPVQYKHYTPCQNRGTLPDHWDASTVIITIIVLITIVTIIIESRSSLLHLHSTIEELEVLLPVRPGPSQLVVVSVLSRSLSLVPWASSATWTPPTKTKPPPEPSSSTDPPVHVLFSKHPKHAAQKNGSKFVLFVLTSSICEGEVVETL